MGRLIDNTYKPTPMSKDEIVETLKIMVFGIQAFERFDAKERETLDKAWNLIDQYEARLKDDMVVMLTEIQLEIEELKNEPACCHHFKRGIRYSSDIIKQKIDTLKKEDK